MGGIVIIGAGECGVRAAFALRERGYDGAITLLGDEPALPYERPPLSKNPDSQPKVIRPVVAYAEARIDLRLGTSVANIQPSDRTVFLQDESSLSYDRLLLATGARARVLPGFEGCLTLRTDSDAIAILTRFQPGARIGIIGAGFIGLELAATARKAGAEVVVVEGAPRVLARAVPPQIADRIAVRHLAEGVELMLGRQVTGADATQIALAGEEPLTFDCVIAGIGSMPATDLAQHAGLHIDNGITVDGNFRTSDPFIYAAGDCCSFPYKGRRVRLESWKAAQDQGSVVAGAMLGESVVAGNVPYFWSDQYDLTLQAAGLFDLHSPIVERAVDGDGSLVFQCQDGALSAAAVVGVGQSMTKDFKVLEKLIEKAAPVDVAVLSDPTQNLKRLLRSA